MQELRILLWLMYQNRNVMFIYKQRGGEHFTKNIVTESYKEGYLRVSDARQYLFWLLEFDYETTGAVLA
jgi:hypothetical protein